MKPENSRVGPGSPPVLVWIGGFAPIGGIETFTADLCQAAIDAGLDVDLLAWDRRSQVLARLRRAGVRVFCSPWRWGCRWHLPDWLLFPLGLWKCRKASVVVFTKTASYSWHRLLNRLGRAGGRRFIYVTPYRPAEMFGDDARTNPVKRKVVAEFLRGFDLIVCQNEIFARDLRALDYQGPLELLPYLAPSGSPAPAPYPQGPITLGFLGRLEHQKNLPELLKAFSLMRREQAQQPPSRPLRLSLFGEGSLRLELENYARELGIASAVTFHGAISRDQVRAAIQGCHLFGFTSHTEGQPLASLEILAEGRPIVATAVGAFPDMLVDPALGSVVPTGDTQAFIAAVRRILARQDAGEWVPHQTVEAYRARFDRDKTLRRYIELLASNPVALPSREGVPEIGPLVSSPWKR